MMIRRGWHGPALLVMLGLVCASAGSATSLSFSGTFTSDTDVQLFEFYVSTPATLTVQTWSFGGGTDAAGQTVEAGGFFPYLAIFDSNGVLTPFESQQLGCVGCNPDPVTRYYYDAYIQTTPLDPGLYTISLTEYDNVPGATLSDGFSHTDPLFTQPFQTPNNSCLPAYDNCLPADFQNAPFLLYESGEKRSGNWEVDITGADSGAELPEPGSLGLALVGIVLLFWPRVFGVRRSRWF